jgi:hypothetical protein
MVLSVFSRESLSGFFALIFWSREIAVLSNIYYEN